MIRDQEEKVSSGFLEIKMGATEPHLICGVSYCQAGYLCWLFMPRGSEGGRD